MQNYKEINGNDYVKDSRTTINETMQSIQSMNSGTAFPTNNLFEGMKCYRTDLKKTYTLTDVENNTWVEDAHATLSDEATHAASTTKLDTARSLNLSGAVTADAATFDGTADTTINVKTLDATKLKGTAPVSTTGNAATASKLATPRTISLTGKAAGSTTFDGSANAAINVKSVNADTASKLSTARKINITGNASGSATFDGSGDISISTTVNESKHAAAANTLSSDIANETSTVARPIWLSWEGDNTRQVVSPNLTYTCGTKTLTAANFKGHLAGNADSATNADKVDGVHAASLFYNKGDWDANNWATIGTYQVNNNPPVSGAYGWGQVISSSTADARFQLYVSHQGSNGRLRYKTGWDNDKSQPWNTILDSENYNLFAPTKTGGGASGTWGINISGNADSATNADTVDGYHVSDIISKIYPVGSIYMSMSATNPHDLFGVGTWQRISQGRMLLGADDSTYKAGATGGASTHILTAEEMPAHRHSGTTSTNGNHTHGIRDSNRREGDVYSFDALQEGLRRYIPTSEAGNHNHTFTTDNSGGGAAHNNMPPYLVCYMWLRTT